ncbi:MgtC/SapB family protein [soil metagenome]
MSIVMIHWPYLPVMERLLLALGLGLFVGLERERRGKEAGLRTFGFAGLLGGLGGLSGEYYALLTIILLGLLIIFLNLQALQAHENAELTTSAALLVTGFAGVLSGQGHTLTPTAVAVMTTALLAWKRPMAGFSIGLSEVELRSAILLAILAFVIYPALPTGSIDPWGAIAPREAWVTVILIAGIGFINYILWKIYGDRGVELTGFLGGLVNSSVAVRELATRVGETQGQMIAVAYRGGLLAIGAMVLRNAVLLAILAPRALASSILAFILMFAASIALAFRHRQSPVATKTGTPADAPLMNLRSPFSLWSVLKFGLVLVVIQAAGVLAQHTLGQVGVYVTSFIGGLFSSSSAVAAAATLAAKGTIPVYVAGICAVIASITSVVINVPLVLGAHQRQLTVQFAWAVAIITGLGIAGALVQAMLLPNLFQFPMRLLAP